MLKVATIVCASILIFAGVIVFPMPIPFGAIMIAAGLVMLISASAHAAATLRLFRRRSRRANAFIQKIEDKMPDGLRRILQRTAP